MRIFNRYIAREFYLATVMSLVVLTFVLMLAGVVQAFEHLSRGMALVFLLEFVLYLAVFALMYALPLSVLCGSLICFGRLSADQEITSLRASGVSLWQILMPCLAVTTVLTVFSLLLQCFWGPYCHHQMDKLKYGAITENPTAFVVPGQYVRISEYMVYVGKTSGDSLIDISLFAEVDGRMHDISASSGSVHYDDQRSMVVFDLQDVNAGVRRELGEAGVGRIYQSNMELPIDFQTKLGRRPIFRREDYMGIDALISSIEIFLLRDKDTTPLLTAMQRRFALGFSPLAFLLVGVPLGIKTRRFRGSGHLVAGLMLFVFYWGFLIFANNLRHSPQAYPQLLVWLPNLLFQVGGLLGIRYISRI